MMMDNLKEELDKHFESFEETNITLETAVNEKRKIVEENKDKKAFIKIKEFPDKYYLGRLEPKNGISFGLKVTESQIETNYCEIIRYENLSELRLCKADLAHIKRSNNKI